MKLINLVFKFGAVLILLFTFSSCLYFPKPMPLEAETVDNFSGLLEGSYKFLDELNNQKDSIGGLKIIKDKNVYKIYDWKKAKDNLETVGSKKLLFQLDFDTRTFYDYRAKEDVAKSSFILKKLKNTFFINVYIYNSEANKGMWHLYTIEIEGNLMTFIQFTYDKSLEDNFKLTRVGDNKYSDYIISVTDDELFSLINSSTKAITRTHFMKEPEPENYLNKYLIIGTAFISVLLIILFIYRAVKK